MWKMWPARAGGMLRWRWGRAVAALVEGRGGAGGDGRGGAGGDGGGGEGVETTTVAKMNPAALETKTKELRIQGNCSLI